MGSWFLGGILEHVDALTGLGSPTVNSYKRLQPGSWAPANTYWGYGNRSGVVRIPGVGKRRHLEFRSPDNSAQPYLLLAGLLGAGADGIRRQLAPPPPFQGDIGHLTAEEIERYGIGFLPRTLPEALAALERDEVVRGGRGRDRAEALPDRQAARVGHVRDARSPVGTGDLPGDHLAMIEVDHLPVVDVHCHPFLNRGAVTAEEFTDLTAFGGGSREYMEQGGVDWSDDVRDELQRGKRNTLYFKRMILDLARFFGVEPDLDAVLAARNAAVAAGYTRVRRRSSMATPASTRWSSISVSRCRCSTSTRCAAELPVEVVPVFRIEPLIADLLKTDIGWAEFQRRYDDTIADALTNQGFKGRQVDHRLPHRPRRLAAQPHARPGIPGARRDPARSRRRQHEEAARPPALPGSRALHGARCADADPHRHGRLRGQPRALPARPT